MLFRIINCVHFASALGAGLVAGVFFAFSSFVMPALSRLPRLQGLPAMQSINIVVLNRSFLGVFLGTAAGSACLVMDALLRWHAPGARLRFGGASLYLLGTVLVTGACNVPRNVALARLASDSAEAARAWSDYVRSWSFWNHVRTAAAIAAAALLMLASSGCTRFRECARPDAVEVRPLPDRLSQTGSFRDGNVGSGAVGLPAAS